MALGLSPTDDPHLLGTPNRVARMFQEELFAREEVRFTTFPSETQGMIVERGIEFNSVCAHHFVPFMGSAHVGYLPLKRMAGLSKLARVVEYHARAPQVQERMTEDIARDLRERLETPHVGVVLEAEHLCMALRGIRKRGASTITSALSGAFLDDADARAEFMHLIRR